MADLVNVDELDTPQLVQRVTEKVGVTEKVRARPSHQRTHLVTEQWGWQELRDYVATEIEKRHGVFPRNPVKESGIFKSFLSRWGDQAPLIARAAFEQHDGWWKGAPISVNRFCKGSDPYFAEVIAKNLS